MKKRNLNSLSLNKKSISNLQSVKGGVDSHFWIWLLWPEDEEPVEDCVSQNSNCCSDGCCP